MALTGYDDGGYDPTPATIAASSARSVAGVASHAAVQVTVRVRRPQARCTRVVRVRKVTCRLARLPRARARRSRTVRPTARPAPPDPDPEPPRPLEGV